MSGTSISGADMAGWVTDFLEANRSAGRKAQEAFGGDERRGSSKLEQIALRMRASASTP